MPTGGGRKPAASSSSLYDVTREQILEVMKACGMTDLSDAAVDRCVADALAMRGASPAQGDDAYDEGDEAADFTRYGGNGKVRGEPATRRGGRPTADLRDDVDHPAPRGGRGAVAAARDDGAATAGYDQQQQQQQQAPNTARAQMSVPPPGHFHHHHPDLPTRGHREHRIERTSISSVRGTPVAGRPLTASPLATTGPSRGGAPQQYADPMLMGATDAHHRGHTSGGHTTTKRAASGAAGLRPASITGREAVGARQHRAGIPGYMNDVYADYVRSAADTTAAFDRMRERAAADGGGIGGKLPQEAVLGRRYQHQDRFRPFVAASSARDHNAENSAPATARTKPGMSMDGPDRSSQQPQKRGSAGFASESGDATSVSRYSASQRAVEQVVTGVIYAPLGSKTYLAGGFRSRSAKAPVASPRFGPPRKVTDPVRRGQQMRECWNRDGFLQNQRPGEHRRQLRWAVRNSMNEWHPEGVYAVDHSYV